MENTRNHMVTNLETLYVYAEREELTLHRVVTVEESTGPAEVSHGARHNMTEKTYDRKRRPKRGGTYDESAIPQVQGGLS